MSKKVTTEELNSLRRLQQETEGLAQEFSRLSMERALLRKEMEIVESRMFDAIDKQQDYIKSLHEKYGDGSLDIETGEITS